MRLTLRNLLLSLSPEPSGVGILFRRWHGLLPAILALGCLSALWGGATGLALGHWTRLAGELDASFPLVAALRDGVGLAEAEALAKTLEARSDMRSVRVMTADVLKNLNLLPTDEPWAQEIGAMDLQYIPPTLQVVVEQGVINPSVRAKARRALTKSEGVDFVWPDAPDVAATRRRLESERTLIERTGWLSLVAVATVWLSFLLIDLRHFVMLVGRDQSENYVSESLALRRALPTLLRGLVVGLGGAAVGAVAVALGGMLAGEELPARAAWLALERLGLFASIAGVGGHAVIGTLLWGHAHRTPRVR